MRNRTDSQADSAGSIPVTRSNIGAGQRTYGRVIEQTTRSFDRRLTVAFRRPLGPQGSIVSALYARVGWVSGQLSSRSRLQQLTMDRLCDPIISAAMLSVPPAIGLVLSVLGADGGRARVDTLLAIQGAGPDYVRQHLAAIDAALGSTSPGIAGLTALIDQAEQAVSTSSPTVERQHVISQVILRKLVENVPPRGKVLAQYHLANGRIDLTGTRGVGVVDDFVLVDSEATERLWQQVEDRLNRATDAALDGTALGDPTHLSTLKDAVALHFARNPQTLTVHNQSFADALDRHLDQTARTPLAAEAFRRRYGLVRAGSEALRLGAEASQERLVTLHRGGGLFRLSVQRFFEKVRDRFDVKGVEILTASGSKEFLLGDVPAITIAATGAYGLSQGVTIDEADKIVMPLTPRLLVAIGPPNASRTITDDEVDSYNEMQVREARDYVVYHPGANLAATIAAWRP
jgi:Protein of unknown function (DUF4238)